MEKNKIKGKDMNLARFGLDQYVTMSPTQTHYGKHTTKCVDREFIQI